MRRRVGLGVRRDEGATAIEYAIMASLIAAVIVVAVWLLGIQVTGLFQLALDAWP